MKVGLKKLGNRGTTAVSQELTQLHLCNTFEPLHQKNVSSVEHRSALKSHLFLKEKCIATVKGCMVVGGNKQRGTIDKVAAHSPTTALESVMLTAAINAAEGCNVAIIDIPKTFLHAVLLKEQQASIFKKVVARSQDNQSTILLKKNGQKSSSKQTKHLNCHYFFISASIKGGRGF